MDNQSFNYKRFADKESANLLFTCSGCGNTCSKEEVVSCCANCSGTLFKVARRSNIGLPMMDDPDSQNDPYNKKHQNLETTTFSEESAGSTMGGPNWKTPISEEPANPNGLQFPSDGSDGDFFENDSYTSQVADTSPLKQPKHIKDISPFNNMRSLTQRKDDPYELLRKRKFR